MQLNDINSRLNNMIKFDDFLNTMVKFFPEIKDAISNAMLESVGEMDTIVVEDIIMPQIIALLRKNEDNKKLIALFEYFEEVVTKADDYLLNVFSVTVLEILGNTREDLNTAKIYMGPITTIKQREADMDLGRNVD